MKARLFAALFFLLSALPVSAQIVGSLPFTLTNGTLADANQVMANFNTIVAAVNSNAATAGANSNITSLIGLTTPLSYTAGGSSVYIGGMSSNSGNNYTVASPLPTGFTLTAGKIVSFTVNASNTGPTQLNANGTGLTNFFRQTTSGPVAMIGGELVANQVALAYFDGTQFECLNCAQQALVPSCTTVDYSGVTIPTGWSLANGAAVSRTTFSIMFNCLAFTSVSATTNSNTTVNITNASTFLQVGWYLGGNNVTCNSYITAVAANSITINAAAGATGATTLTIGPFQQGDCATTFNLPNYTGKVLAAVDGSTNITTTCPNSASVGDKTQTPNTGCGNQATGLLQSNLPNVTLTGGTTTGSDIVKSTTTTLQNVSSGSGVIGLTSGTVSVGNDGVQIPLGGSGATFSQLQPTSLVYKIIKN